LPPLPTCLPCVSTTSLPGSHTLHCHAWLRDFSCLRAPIHCLSLRHTTPLPSLEALLSRRGTLPLLLFYSCLQLHHNLPGSRQRSHLLRLLRLPSVPKRFGWWGSFDCGPRVARCHGALALHTFARHGAACASHTRRLPAYLRATSRGLPCRYHHIPLPFHAFTISSCPAFCPGSPSQHHYHACLRHLSGSFLPFIHLLFFLSRREQDRHVLYAGIAGQRRARRQTPWLWTLSSSSYLTSSSPVLSSSSSCLLSFSLLLGSPLLPLLGCPTLCLLCLLPFCLPSMPRTIPAYFTNGTARRTSPHCRAFAAHCRLPPSPRLPPTFPLLFAAYLFWPTYHCARRRTGVLAWTRHASLGAIRSCPLGCCALPFLPGSAAATTLPFYYNILGRYYRPPLSLPPLKRRGPGRSYNIPRTDITTATAHLSRGTRWTADSTASPALALPLCAPRSSSTL